MARLRRHVCTSARRSCPHLGADLATGTVDCGALICPLARAAARRAIREFGWKPLPSHDDGVLAWVRLDGVGGEEPLDAAGDSGPARPATRLDAVTRVVGTCEPTDIIANRLDPWHGAWYHPYSFTQLEVLSRRPSTPTDPKSRTGSWSR